MQRMMMYSATSLLALNVGIAHAQSSDAGLALEEIVVTAEKRNTDLQKTAISIQVTSGEELSKQGKKRINDILKGTAGVQLQENASGANIYMRGVGNNDGIPGGGERAVAIFIDGIYQTRTETVRSGTLDVSQVEVMRGPQGTNLGGSSMAGAVSLVANQPVFNYEASGSVEAGNYNMINMEGILNLPLSDNQALRAAYSSNKHDGYLSNGNGDNDITTARLKYRWQINDDLNLIVTVGHQRTGGYATRGALTYNGYWENYNPLRDRTNGIDTNSTTAGTQLCGATGSPTAAADCYDRVVGFPGLLGHVNNANLTYKDRSNPWDDGYPAGVYSNQPQRLSDVISYSADINWSLGGGTLTIAPAVQNSHNKITEMQIGGLSYNVEDYHEKNRQLDVRYAATWRDLQWLVGAYYFHRNEPFTRDQVVLPGNAAPACAGPNSATPGFQDCHVWGSTLENSAETHSLYGNVTYSLTDTLRLLGGLRYSEDKKHSQTSTTITTTGTGGGGLLGPGTAFVYGPRAEGGWNETTYRGGVEYDWRPESMLYATYSTGYQPGTIDTMGTSGNFPKQTIEQLTIGMKNRFFDNKLQVNLEAFNSTYHNRNLQGTLRANIVNANGLDGSTITTCRVAQPAAAGSPNFFVDAGSSCVSYNYTATVPKMTSRGADLDVNFLLTSNDRIDLTAEYLQATQSTPAVPRPTSAELAALAAATAGTHSTDPAGDAAKLAAGFATALDSYEGLTLQNSPKWTLNASYQHDFRFAGGSTLTPKLSGVYKTRYWSAAGGTANIANPALSYQEAFSTFDAYTTWVSADGKYSITGSVKNLENEPIMLSYNAPFVFLDSPRTYSLIINAKF
ncbi:MAG: TonB-dependent receptor [Steroidobacteraceae bacterium]